MKQDGWVHNIQVGKVRSTGLSLHELACQHELNSLTTIELVVTPNRGNIRKSAIFQTMEFTKVHVLHEAYSLDIIIDSLELGGWNPEKDCQLME